MGDSGPGMAKLLCERSSGPRMAQVALGDTFSAPWEGQKWSQGGINGLRAGLSCPRRSQLALEMAQKGLGTG